jgi:hypothetical protein
MSERDAAQAEALIQALCDLRDKMIGQVNWLERHGSQLEATALRRDINEAQAHSLVCNAAIWVEVCGHFNPFARRGNTFRAASSPPRGATIPLLSS